MALTESHAHGPSEPAVRDLTLHGALAEAVADQPDRIALIAGTPDPAARREWTYTELQDQVTRVARALRARFEPGERVAIWAPNIPEWVLCEFGASMAGVILVTVNPSFQPAEVTYVLNQSRAAGILVTPSFRGNAMLATVEQVQPDCPELREVIRFDEWEAFLASGDDADVVLPDVSPADPVMIQYTSGTTGFPKGALLHHRGLVNNGWHTADRMQGQDGWVWVNPMPLFHTGGCVCSVLGALALRATQVLVEAFDPALVLELFETYGGQVMLGVPTMLVAMLEHPDYATRDLSTVSSVCSGGSIVPAPIVERFEEGLGAPFTIVFGQTESSPVSSMTAPDDTIADKANTIGPPMPGTEVKIIDPVTLETVPIGVTGEYCTRGYHVMLGYFENPEATDGAIDDDGWLHTGDLCAMDDRGYCTVEGRLKDMIIRGGENIYPKEIEEVLYRHPSVSDVAVIGIPDDRFGEVVGAVLRPAPGETLDRQVLFDHVRAHLSPQKTPTKWFAAEAFPMTGSGKIQKYRLVEDSQSDVLQELT